MRVRKELRLARGCSFLIPERKNDNGTSDQGHYQCSGNSRRHSRRKKIPSLAGLIGVMPLTGALVLIWMYFESKGNHHIMREFSKGALWGILPTFLFFLTAYICFKKQLPLSVALLSGFGVWGVAALVHQSLLK